MKFCSKCGIEYDISFFYKNSAYKDWYINWCKMCKHKYEIDNKDKFKILRSERYQKNKDKIKKLQKEYNEKNRDRINERSKSYYRKNKHKRKWERLKPEKRAYMKKYFATVYKDKKREKDRLDYIKHREKRLAYQKWYRKTEEWKLLKRIYWHKRREWVKLTDDWSITMESLKKILIRQNHKCNICWCELNCYLQYSVHLDHIYPLSRGWKHVLDNVQFLCGICNGKKRAKIM